MTANRHHGQIIINRFIAPGSEEDVAILKFIEKHWMPKLTLWQRICAFFGKLDMGEDPAGAVLFFIALWMLYECISSL